MPVRLQAYFFGWGFYALGHDDAMERKLTGRPITPPAPTQTTADADDETLPRGGPAFAPPTRENESPAGISNSRERAHEMLGQSVRGEGGAGVEIEVCDEENPAGTEEGDVGNSTGDGREGGKGRRWAGLRHRIRRVLVSPNIISVATGVVISMIAPLQEMMFDDPRAVLRPLGAALQVSGEGSLVFWRRLTQMYSYHITKWGRCVRAQSYLTTRAPRSLNSAS